jgi:pilus assembly protein CpaF
VSRQLDPASSALLDRVRNRLASEPADVGAAIRAEAHILADDVVLGELRQQVAAELEGAGPLEALLAAPGVTDVLVNAPDEVWIDRGHGLERTGVRFADDGAVRRLAVRLAGATGRRLDDSAPFVDAAMADGTRLHAALPPIVRSTTISLRVLARSRYELADLVETGSASRPVADLLRAVVEARLAFVISGGTGTGKTTLLGALLGCADPGERLLIVEDAAEIVTSHPHVVRLVTRSANVEGAGRIDLRDLVRQSLRMRPDRIVVGEFRGAEMADLLAALNTGHAGGAATMHANAVADVPSRFAALGALSGMDRDCTHAQVASALQVVIQLRRVRSGRRVVAEIGLLDAPGGELISRIAWAPAGPGPGAERLAALIEAGGVRCPAGWR